ncbi:MAG: aminodeoxychorismate/anthranilate synthase component II [Chloroflexi bacterium]|uniref:Aminodeoxychorismate/anthranilate synthase component II n=1 Tax=Candidatus Chlorohelix allophototropha TaxID=3003348 RepID=A0A8T7LY03_9CHLR|nr:aminodeoxychorismate/anthranilate synthase component II [Chloroflexota bacterium]WJW67021.1 aminodeoxychorismate/anthranilate synthase component II [Chloroflexota bacterium L227-S17]
MLLMIDNYDSFTYNLVQYFAELGEEVLVYRNDAITLDEISRIKPARIVISPGPGEPKDAGVSEDVIRQFGTGIPILGVCLGHQAIGEVFGGTVERAPELMHGKVSPIHHNGEGVFAGIPQNFKATRYHSLVVRQSDLPSELEVTASTESGLIMGLRHRQYPIHGVQFHPESILTENGKDLLRNFLSIKN